MESIESFSSYLTSTMKYLCSLFYSIIKSRYLLKYSTFFRTEEAAKCLEATKLQSSNQFTEEFTVMEGLMGSVFIRHHTCAINIIRIYV